MRCRQVARVECQAPGDSGAGRQPGGDRGRQPTTHVLVGAQDVVRLDRDRLTRRLGGHLRISFSDPLLLLGQIGHLEVEAESAHPDLGFMQADRVQVGRQALSVGFVFARRAARQTSPS